MLPLCLILGFRVHLISRSKGFSCMQSWPIEVDWSLTPIFILIEETTQQNLIGKRKIKTQQGQLLKSHKNLCSISADIKNGITYYTKLEASKAMEKKRGKKEKGIMHYTKISRKASTKEIELGKRKLASCKTTLHTSAILTPAAFASTIPRLDNSSRGNWSKPAPTD